MDFGLIFLNLICWISRATIIWTYMGLKFSIIVLFFEFPEWAMKVEFCLQSVLLGPIIYFFCELQIEIFDYSLLYYVSNRKHLKRLQEIFGILRIRKTIENSSDNLKGPISVSWELVLGSIIFLIKLPQFSTKGDRTN